MIAIQEVRDVQCLKELQSRLNAAAASTRSKTHPMVRCCTCVYVAVLYSLMHLCVLSGLQWQYVVSPPIGRGLRNQDAAHVHEER